jgi:hypothetical protein
MLTVLWLKLLRCLWVWHAAIVLTESADIRFYDAFSVVRNMAEGQCAENGDDPYEWETPEEAVAEELTYWTEE